MNNKIKVDVVLTAYKRVSVLREQIDALSNQTYKVNNIYLFQDGIDSYYKVVLDDEFLNNFKGVYISDSNVGVWGRFEYAYKTCESDYVCIFDDDTIPGNQWIENCVSSFVNCPGVYGTNGVVVTDKDNYPYTMIRVGWLAPNRTSTQVDFVGHSWFLKKEWLEWMLEKRKQYNYKYVAEDMAISYACQEHGINTYVPAHPYDNVQMWGSKPKEGLTYGVQSVALSKSPHNLDNMKLAMMDMISNGWSMVLDAPNFEEIIKKSLISIDEMRDIILADIRRFALDNGGLYLYGAGNFGRKFASYLHNNGIKLLGFVVSEVRDNSMTVDNCQIEIISVEDYNKLSNGGLLLSLDIIHHYEVINKVEQRYKIFSLDDKTYSYKDIVNMVFDYEK